jgi:uncharacterized SAM-binding protein YcdF (DUF218 family)
VVLRFPRLLLVVAGLAAAAVLTHSTWMSWLGRYLIEAGPPARAAVVVVLAGDQYGNRILKAAELARQGYADKVVVSGPPCCYGQAESDLAVDFAVRHGFPPGLFVKAPHSGQSTRDEAQILTALVRKLGARSFLLVTSDYHTRRAGGLFRKQAQGLEMHVVAAPDQFFRYDSWWRNREASRLFYMEWSKHAAEFLGM